MHQLLVSAQVFGHLKVKLQRLSSSHPGNANTKAGTDTALIGDLLIGSKVKKLRG